MSEKPTLVSIDPTGLTTEKREQLLNSRPFVRHIRSAITWFGIGALVHAWFLGPDFDPDNLWSWGYLIAWPIPMTFWLVIQAGVFGFWFLVVVGILALAWFAGKAVVGGYRRLQERRKQREDREVFDAWLDEPSRKGRG